MTTEHNVFFANANKMNEIEDCSVDLIVTSPPYPMIEMWDKFLLEYDIDREEPDISFEIMHDKLNLVWAECVRVLKNGGFICINIGDATRTINGNFELFDNHSKIVSFFKSFGLTELPCIIWRKQTNAPNKFMGSGMLPNGAYVTLEHEYILIFRKGDKRLYNKESDKILRRESGFFWEERNLWFSDIWDFKGVQQTIHSEISRERNASYPLELPHRLINMYSQKDDVVLDPFIGLGTTMKASILNRRNFIGYDIDKTLKSLIEDNINSSDINYYNGLIEKRINNHLNFIKSREDSGKEVKYYNDLLKCKVISSQEQKIYFNKLEGIINESDENMLKYKVSYL